MDTGRKLSWLEQQDLDKWKNVVTAADAMALMDEWGDGWTAHIGRLYREQIYKPVNVRAAVYL